MIAWFIACAIVFAGYVFICYMVDGFDRPAVIFFGIIWVIIFSVFLWTVIDAFYERAAFSAVATCKAKRMSAVRKSMTANVVCVPSYRNTKNDTLTVNVP